MLFGGSPCQQRQFCPWGDPNGPVYYTDTWELDGAGQWTRRAGQVSAMGTTSLPAGMAFDSDRNRILLYNIVFPGGVAAGGLWEWTGSTWIMKPANLPVADALTMAYDSGRRRTVFAGTGFGFLLTTGVWEWRYFVDDPTCSLGPP